METTTTRPKMTADEVVDATGGKVTIATLARLCEIRGGVPAKWARFVAGAASQMGLTQEQVDAVVAFVES
jgi:hypothetical protein